MPRTIIVSNRLPVKVIENQNNELEFKPSEGGLATGLGSVYKQGDNLWIGWPGREFADKKIELQTTAALKAQNMWPVFLTEEEITLYYEGFSNEMLWPIFHYFNQYAVFKKSYWKSYEAVNKNFCNAVLEVLSPGDKI